MKGREATQHEEDVRDCDLKEKQNAIKEKGKEREEREKSERYECVCVCVCVRERERETISYCLYL